MRLGKYDDYAARFCRRFFQATSDGAFAVTVSNPRPHDLVSFAAACVWRMAAARSDSQPINLLGPYAEHLRQMLFGDATFDPLLLVSRSAFVHGKDTLNLSMLPHRYQELGINFWRFVACGIIFDLKLDARPAPPAMAMLAVNDARDVLLHEDFPQQVLGTPMIAASLRMMGGAGKR